MANSDARRGFTFCGKKSFREFSLQRDLGNIESSLEGVGCKYQVSLGKCVLMMN
jgi:hypothetical protein